jgi:hypothetical protein
MFAGAALIWMVAAIPGVRARIRGIASRPGTRLKVRSFGMDSKPCGASVWTVRIPFDFVLRMELKLD